MDKLFRSMSWIAGAAAFLFCYVGYNSDDLMLYLIGICIVGVMLILSWVKDRQRRKMNAQKPPVTVEATVVNHRIIQEKAGSRYITRYYITFRPTDGSSRLEFEVSQLDFEDFDVGETGPLRYRGREFLSFGVKDKSSIKPLAPLPEEYEPRPGPQPWHVRIRQMFAKGDEMRQGRSNPSKNADDGILTHELDA